MSQNQNVQYYRNKTNYCYIGRPLTVPKWVKDTCCPPIAPGGFWLGLGPHDEEPSDNGVMKLLLANGNHFTVCAIGPAAAVDEELDRLNVVPLEDRHFKCSGKSHDGKEDWVAKVFIGAHRVIEEVTHEKADAIKLGGTITATQNVVKLQEQNVAAEREIAALRAKLAAIEEKTAADSHRSRKGSVV